MFQKFIIPLLLIATFAFNPRFARAQNAQPTPEIRGIWVHTYSPQPWDVVMKKIADAGLNCVFVRVARGVNALYPSKILPMDGWAADAWKNGKGKDELKTMIEAAHRNGLEFHAWKVNFNASAGMRAGVGPAAFYQKMKADDRLMRDVNGVQTTALNPGDPRNRQLEVDVMKELVDNYDVDGVHFDYIRYTEIGGDGKENYDFDYGPISRFEFEKARGMKVANWPVDVFSGHLKAEYEDWERENINDVVKRVYANTKASKPRVQVSAAVWRANRKYRAGLKQDWMRWARENWLDFVVPMDYSADNARFESDMKEQIPNVAGHIPFAAGIGNYLIKDPQDVVKQIEIARTNGADGYVLFAYNDDNIDAVLAAVKTANAVPAVPSYRAPRAKWSVLGGIERKDAPMAFASGGKMFVSVEFAGDQREWKSASARLEIDNGGKTANLGGSIELPDASSRRGKFSPQFLPPLDEFPVAAGVSQLVLRGTATDANGKTWPIAIRGPLVEGLTPSAIFDLKARALPPHFAPDQRAVAVYAGGQASASLMKNLQDAPNVDAELIYALKPAMWKNAKVLIVPHLEDVQDLTPQTIRDLRKYVSDGGRLILTHDAVGYRWHQRLFPEIGVGVERLDGKNIIVGANNWNVTPGAVTQGYSDHVIIAATPGASVLAREAKSDKAVVVAGYFGRGTVIMDGTLLGAPSEGEMPASEKQLLWELVGATL